jgi:Na+-driven multidrug efflux pump
MYEGLLSRIEEGTDVERTDVERTNALAEQNATNALPNPPEKMAAELEETFNSFFLNHLRRVIPTILTYDNVINIPVLGIMMARLGRGDAAPAATTLLNIITYLQFASVLPSSFRLGTLSGQLITKKKLLANTLDATLSEEISEIEQEIGRIPRNTVLAGLICAPAILTMTFAEPVLTLFKQDSSVSIPAQDFLRPYSPFFLAFSPRLAMEFVLLASGKEMQSMGIALAVLASSIGVEYVLGFETSFKVAGLGIGYGIGTVLAAFGFTAYAIMGLKGFKFLENTISWNKNDCKQIKTFGKQSIPIILTGVSDVSMAFVTSLFAGYLPGNALAMQNVAAQYLNLDVAFTSAGSYTASVIVSEQRGKAKTGGATYDSMRLATKVGIISTMITQIPMIVVVVSAPGIINYLVGEPTDENQTRYLLLLTGGYSIIDGVRLTLLQSTRALTDGDFTPSILSSICLWMGAGVSYLLSQHTSLGILGLPVGLACGALLGTVILKNQLEKQIQSVIKLDNALEATPLQPNGADPSVNSPARRDKPAKAASKEQTGTGSLWCEFLSRPRNIPRSEAMTQPAATSSLPDAREKSWCGIM